MHDDLDLRVIERPPDADPDYRDAVRRQVVAILDGRGTGPDRHEALEPAVIDLVSQRSGWPGHERRRWLAGVVLGGAAALIFALIVLAPGDEAQSPADQPTLPTTTATAFETVPTTVPVPDSALPVIEAAPVTTPELFTEIAPGSYVDLPEAPIAGRGEAATVWTGSEMIVWSGGADGVLLTDGAAFDLANGTWRVIAPAPIAARQNAAAVWTGAEMIVWGGFIGEDVRVDDGAAYDPVTDTWRTLAPMPVSIGPGATVLQMAWTGSEAVVRSEAVTAAYDPVADSWRLVGDGGVWGKPMWTGDSIVWVEPNKLTRYEPATDRWTTATGSYAAVVGLPSAEGATDTFVAVPIETGAPVQVLDHSLDPIGELPAFPGDPTEFGETIGAGAHWVGDEVVLTVFAGTFPYEPEQAWTLNPATQTWRRTPEVPDHIVRAMYWFNMPVVVGDVMLVWGEEPDLSNATSGLAYRAGAPISD